MRARRASRTASGTPSSMGTKSLLNSKPALAQPGRIPRPSIFLLSWRGARVLAQLAGASPDPFVKRAEHARNRAFHVLHDIEANAFFVALAAASRSLRHQGLYHWVGERGCWAA